MPLSLYRQLPVHVVKANERLSAIAAHYQRLVSDIVAVNPFKTTMTLSNGETVFASLEEGEQLALPQTLGDAAGAAFCLSKGGTPGTRLRAALDPPSVGATVDICRFADGSGCDQSDFMAGTCYDPGANTSVYPPMSLPPGAICPVGAIFETDGNCHTDPSGVSDAISPPMCTAPTTHWDVAQQACVSTLPPQAPPGASCPSGYSYTTNWGGTCARVGNAGAYSTVTPTCASGAWDPSTNTCPPASSSWKKYAIGAGAVAVAAGCFWYAAKNLK